MNDDRHADFDWLERAHYFLGGFSFGMLVTFLIMKLG